MFNPDLLARFTTHLKEALQKGLLFAVRNGRPLLEPGDLLVGLLQEKGSIGAEVLQKLEIQLPLAEERFAGRAQSVPAGTTIAPDLTPATKRVLEKCVLLAHVSEHKYVGTEHLLFSLLDLNLLDIQTFLREQGVDIAQAKEQVSQVLKSTARFPDLTPPSETEASDALESASEAEHQPAAHTRGRTSHAQRVKALDVFARELTAQQTVERLDPVIGREMETDRVIEILCRRTKNNTLLLGEPGVGKTAIVEGLAQRIVSGDIPDILQGKRLYALDLALMVAGTMYRGEFEARLKQLVDEVKSDQNILLFIDEIHTMVGAGSTSGLALL
jgi:ATP-dependent Clp protease ATP-binding subunit ClpC